MTVIWGIIWIADGAPVPDDDRVNYLALAGVVDLALFTGWYALRSFRRRPR